MSETPPTTGSFRATSLLQQGWQARWRRARLSHSGQRLTACLDTYYAEMTQLEVRVRAAGLDTSKFGFPNLARLIEQSAEALDNGQLELGWSFFNTARRMETQITYDLSQQASPIQSFAAGMFQSFARSLLIEGSKKLGGWRKSALNQALTKNDGQLKDKLELSDLIIAQQILAEHHTNVYRRIGIIGDQIRFLEWIALLALIGWVMLLIFMPNLEEKDVHAFSLSLTISSLLLGALGACISGIFRLEKSSTQQNIPDQLQSYTFTIARPLVGAVSALGVVIFVMAGILQLGEQTPGLYLAAAFAAGFSERLLKMGVKESEGENKDAKAQK
jgi:hypothetical protein